MKYYRVGRIYYRINNMSVSHAVLTTIIGDHNDCDGNGINELEFAFKDLHTELTHLVRGYYSARNSYFDVNDLRRELLSQANAIYSVERMLSTLYSGDTHDLSGEEDPEANFRHVSLLGFPDMISESTNNEYSGECYHATFGIDECKEISLRLDVRKVVLNGQQFDNNCIKVLLNNKDIQHLTLRGTSIEATLLESICNHNTITSLEITETDLSKWDFSLLQHLTALTRISFRKCILPAIHTFRNASIRSLDYSYSNYSDDQIKDIIARNGCLIELSVGGGDVSNNTIMLFLTKPRMALNIDFCSNIDLRLDMLSSCGMLSIKGTQYLPSAILEFIEQYPSVNVVF